MTNLLKLAMAILLFICLLDMPYGYYELVRFIAMLVFGVLAYQCKAKGELFQVFIFIAFALLFQLFVKIALGRPIWTIVDIIVGVGLLISLVKSKTDKKRKEYDH